MTIEWFGREDLFAIEKLGSKLPSTIKWALYYAIIFAVFHFSGNEQPFIYFQF